MRILLTVALALVATNAQAVRFEGQHRLTGEVDVLYAGVETTHNISNIRWEYAGSQGRVFRDGVVEPTKILTEFRATWNGTIQLADGARLTLFVGTEFSRPEIPTPTQFADGTFVVPEHEYSGLGISGSYNNFGSESLTAFTNFTEIDLPDSNGVFFNDQYNVRTGIGPWTQNEGTRTFVGDVGTSAVRVTGVRLFEPTEFLVHTPEPSTALLLLVGSAGLLTIRR